MPALFRWLYLASDGDVPSTGWSDSDMDWWRCAESNRSTCPARQVESNHPRNVFTASLAAVKSGIPPVYH